MNCLHGFASVNELAFINLLILMSGIKALATVS